LAKFTYFENQLKLMRQNPYSYSKRSEIPFEGFAKKDLFDEFGFNLAFQFNIGYRF